jgi:hypothetical protein
MRERVVLVVQVRGEWWAQDLLVFLCLQVELWQPLGWLVYHCPEEDWMLLDLFLLTIHYALYLADLTFR